MSRLNHSKLKPRRKNQTALRPPLRLGIAAAWLSLCVVASPNPAAEKQSVEFILAPGTNQMAEAEAAAGASLETIQVLKRRLRGYSCLIEPPEGSELSVQILDLPEGERAQMRKLLQLAGRLEFRMVHPSNEFYLAENLVPSGYDLLKAPITSPGETLEVPHLVKRQAEVGLEGAHVHRVSVHRDRAAGSLREPKAEAQSDYIVMKRPSVGSR